MAPLARNALHGEHFLNEREQGPDFIDPLSAW